MYYGRISVKRRQQKVFADGISLYDAAKELSNSLAKKVLVAKVNGDVTDLRETIVDGSTVEFLTFDAQEGKDTLRHTASHIMAQAVQRLFKDVKLAIGPSIENGFYYDFDTEHGLRRKISPPSKQRWKKSSKKISL